MIKLTFQWISNFRMYNLSMERIRSINPERIVWCCDDYGISLAVLATELGISLPTLESVVEGEGKGLTFNQLSKMAAYFGRGILFFLERDPVNEERVHTAAFRTLANQKPELSVRLRALIERVEWQRTIYLSLIEEMADSDFPRFLPPEISVANIPNAARLVRQWLGLDNRNAFTFDTYRSAVEAKGILVFRSNGYNGKWQIPADSPVLGFALYDLTCPVIVVKKQEFEPVQSFTLMHELGHILLHRSSSIDDDDDMHSHRGGERDANAFAGMVLVPDEFLALIDDARRPDAVADFDEWLTPYRRAWGVSGEVILRRLLDSGRLTRMDYANYRAWKAQQTVQPAQAGGARIYRHREPKHIFGDRFVRTILDALSSQRITLAKASSYLDGLKVSDVHELEKHYAGV
ncbi:ImmA/IrrE family metallo-endopeptidase [Duganella sp. BuS-21]|uniref:ImmA/IrrE family metallo-endopeptidase n=1 Tax=Duganella sp. BuS-21 TaxID=2943848 RepID=UPI0035A695F9